MFSLFWFLISCCIIGFIFSLVFFLEAQKNEDNNSTIASILLMIVFPVLLAILCYGCLAR